MLLRFRVGSGPTKPPSVSPPRAALAATLPPHPLASSSHRPCSGDSHYLAYAGLARWWRMVVVCTCTMRVHVHAYTRLARSMSTSYTPSPQIPPLRLLSSPAFPPILIPLVLNYARGTLHSFLSLGAAASAVEPNGPLFFFLFASFSYRRAWSRNASPILRLHRTAKDDPAWSLGAGRIPPRRRWTTRSISSNASDLFLWSHVQVYLRINPFTLGLYLSDMKILSNRTYFNY